MELFKAIEKRRSIRKFTDEIVPKETVEKIINAGLQAPSSKNRQPWRFVAVSGDAKAGMLEAMNAGLHREEMGDSELPGSRQYLEGAKHTMSIMQAAPVTIFIINPLGRVRCIPSNAEEQFYELANVQSVGAAIQNMLLAATDTGLGSLWNCDIYFAYKEICNWLETNEQVIAAISIGFNAEDPNPGG